MPLNPYGDPLSTALSAYLDPEQARRRNLQQGLLGLGTDMLSGQPSPVPTSNWAPMVGGLGMLGAGLLRKPQAPTGGAGLLAGGLNTMGGIGQITGSPMSPLNAPTAMPSGAGWWKRNIGSIF